MKTLDEYGFADFKSRICGVVRDHANWYFSQTKDAYYADYRPRYPQKSAADFTIVLDFSHTTTRLSVYADTALVPIIRQYSSMDCLICDLLKM